MFIDMIFISVEHCFTLNYMIGVRFTTSVNLDFDVDLFREQNKWFLEKANSCVENKHMVTLMYQKLDSLQIV